MKKSVCMLLCMALLFSSVVTMAQKDLTIYINGQQAILDTPCQWMNDILMVPVKEVLERMGVFVKWGEYDRRAVMKQGILATISGVEMIVPPDSPEACYDEIWFELSTPTIRAGVDVLVPLEFIQYFYDVEVTLNKGVLRIVNHYVPKKNAQDMNEDELNKLLAELPSGEDCVGKEFLKNSVMRNGDGGGYFTKTVLPPDEAAGLTDVIELETLSQPSHDYDAQLETPVNTKLKKGDFVVLTFWARMLSSADESGMATLGYNVEEFAKGSYKSTTLGSFYLTHDWKKYTISFVAIQNWDAGAWRICNKVGYKPQTIQIADLTLTNYHDAVEGIDINTTKTPVDTYYGREDGALWRQEALKRIEKYRVRDIKVNVTDESGNPVQGAEITANMTRSEFWWGTIGPFFYGNVLGENLRNYFLTKFNAITPESAMKISGYKSTGLQYGSGGGGGAAIDHANFAIKNNLYLHGHAVMWDQWRYLPDEMTRAEADELTKEEIRNIFFSYAGELVRYFGDAMGQLDVLNEPDSNFKYRTKYGADLIADLYRLVELMRNEYAPNMKIYLNEAGIIGSQTSSWDKAKRLDVIIRDLKSRGAHIEGLGCQNHTQPIYYPQTIYNQFDYSSDLVDELMVTEYDSVYIGDALTTEEKLELEGDHLRDNIILAYSNPKMKGFIMWGMYDQQHWRGDAPMLDIRFREKPGVKYWNQLVLDEWMTKTGGSSDTNGLCVMRGHRGEYDVIVSLNGKQAATTLKVSDTGVNMVNAVVHPTVVSLLHPLRRL